MKIPHPITFDFWNQQMYVSPRIRECWICGKSTADNIKEGFLCAECNEKSSSIPSTDRRDDESLEEWAKPFIDYVNKEYKELSKEKARKLERSRYNGYVIIGRCRP